MTVERTVYRSSECLGRRQFIMYSALLIEGKEPPIIADEGIAVRVTFLARKPSVSFRMFVAEEADRGRLLNVEHLLLLQNLLRHPEIDTATAAAITQQPEWQVREVLSEMALERGYIERGGTGRGTYWALRRELHDKLAAAGHPDRDPEPRRISECRPRVHVQGSGVHGAMTCTEGDFCECNFSLGNGIVRYCHGGRVPKQMKYDGVRLLAVKF